ncbi:hypothetical protein KP509_22G022800 [Ceratopteris richardii]|uniref:Uncharacterized protein n=1 Tax=Ceratopteris richardii TaxID=49495 RepID=A0A8T2S499_CERRI|nr:hypothetical protein KP509_22G022800 [Ceratopteris richardii]KAH7306627.1 hypothetical protein KP509_22G022800 [Ceratopteris richardii]KAH7306628.1 hypothetical protein KP509_22G022800 [Ceratopteris richardii]
MENKSVKIENQTVVIKGWNLDPSKIRSDVSKYTGKHAEIVPVKKDSQEKDNTNKNGVEKEKNAGKKQETQPSDVYHPQYFSDENPNACIVM